MNNSASTSPGQAPKIFEDSVVGEEDSGSAVEPPATTHPGDESPAGAPGTGQVTASLGGA
jgi:hypothetical protein